MKKYCWHQSKKRNMQQQVDDVQSDEKQVNHSVVEKMVLNLKSHQQQAIMLVATKHGPLTHSPATISD